MHPVGQRLLRRARLGIYDEARPILVAIIARQPPPPMAGDIAASTDAHSIADQLLVRIDQAWRLAERHASAEKRRRRDRQWPALRAALGEHERRAHAVFKRFDRRRRDLGARAAAKMAAQLWTGRLPYSHRHDRAAVLPVLWEREVASALIETLERALGRRLHLGGPDNRLLVALFNAACADRRQRGLAVELQRGKGARRPGTPSWFLHVLRTRRGLPGGE